MSKNNDIEKMLGSIGKKEVPSEIRDLSSGMIYDFSRAIEVAENSQSDKRRFTNWLGGFCYRFAAGAAFALIVIAAYFVMTRTSSIAWADVVAAVGKVDQMRAKVIVEDPRSSDEKIFTIEMFYKAPDKCRAHGRGFVQFINGSNSRIFSVEKRALLDEDKNGPALIPPGFMSMLQEKGLLNSMLEIIFRSKVPEAEPVISTTALAGDGVEVFDYANNANEMWARVWVLKESRLPMRLKMFYPGRDETNLVIFDYTDGQGDEFFDVDKFMDQAKSTRKGQSHRFYNIGKSVVTADPRKPENVKPVNPVQIHKLEGIKAPEFKSLTHYTNGIIVIRAIDPGNRDKNGYGVDGEYREEIRDNWGNIYLRYHSTPGSYKGMKMEMCYFPVEPYKKGDGEHKIRLTYTVLDYKYNLGYDRILSDEEVVVGEPLEEFPKFLLKHSAHKDIQRRLAYMNFMTMGGVGMLEQWDYVNAALEETKDSESMVKYKMRLVREFEGDDAYFRFFENNLLGNYYKHGFGNLMHKGCLAGYLHYLYTNDRADEYEKHAKVLYKKMKDFIKDKNTSRYRRNRITNHELRLRQVLEIPTVEKKLKRAATPKILRKKLSSDGKLLISFDFPTDKNGVQDRSKFTGGIKVAKTGEYAEQTMGNVYRFDVSGNSLTLLFDAAIEGFLTDRKGGRHPKLTIAKAVKIDLPKASDKTADELIKEFPAWKKELERRAEMNDWGRAVSDANRLRHDGKQKQAYDMFAKSVGLRIYDPEEFPNYGKVENQIIQQEVWFKLQMAECSIELGEIDNALVVVNECYENFLSMTEKPVKGLGGYACHDDVFKVRVKAAEWLIDNDKLERAELLLNEIVKSRPDFRMVSNLATVEKTPFGYRGEHKRVRFYFHWKVYDKAVWKLRRAREGN